MRNCKILLLIFNVKIHTVFFLDQRLQRLENDLRRASDEIEALTNRLRNLQAARDGNDRANAIQELDRAIAARREYIARIENEIETLELEIENEELRAQIELNRIRNQAAIQHRNDLLNRLNNLGAPPG